MKQKIFFSVCAGIMCLLIGCQKEETNNLSGNKNIRKANTVLYFNEANPSVYYDIFTHEVVHLDGTIFLEDGSLEGCIHYDENGNYLYFSCEPGGTTCGRATEYDSEGEVIRTGWWCRDDATFVIEFGVDF